MKLKQQVPAWIGLAVLLVAVISQAAQAGTNPVATLHDPDGVVADNFGYSTALSADGSTVLIGAFSTQTNGVYTGSAYIYTKVNGAWSDAPMVVFNNPNTTLDNGRFGTAVALSADGNVALISAPYLNFVRGTNYTRVYIYRRTNGVWSSTPMAVFLDPGSDDVDGFGDCAALSADGTTALIGAWGTAVNGTDKAGKAYIFRQINGAWSTVPIATFADPGAVQYDDFGISCALSGDGIVALIGTQQAFGPGRAFMYSATNGVWASTPTVVFNDPGAIKGDEFGSSVALSATADTALIGGTYPNAAGIVYVFVSAGNTWSTVPEAQFNDPEMHAGDWFGASLALSGDGTIALIGADDTPVMSGSVSLGKAYVFTQTNGLWSIAPEATFADPGAANNLYLDEFGTSVALSSNGTVALIGTPQTPGLSPPPPNNVPTYGGPGVAYIYESSDGWSNPPPPPGGGGTGQPGGGALGMASLVLLLVMLGLCTRKGAARRRS